METARLRLLLGIFIFCSLSTLILSGIDGILEFIYRSSKDPCALEVRPGSCDEVQRRYFYNKTAKACGSFLFTGCGGNLNNFKIKMECEVACLEEHQG
uniref:BPTI/Kunitz inhibitor domain-containing protein n=2 Tax=Jaculus jaculus TaxID=51337 RepID=A0A8C5KI56_JACJA